MGASVDFEWVNPVKEVPVRRHIALSILRYTTGNGVTLIFDRWPDPEYVPLYADAQHVQVAWVHGPDPQVDNFERVTTYETSASVDEIEAYYKDAMLQNGWRPGNSEPPTHFFFSYRHDLPCPQHTSNGVMYCGTGSLVDLYIYPQENGTTKVELRAAGDEIDALHQGK